MAINTDAVQRLYVAYFNRPADPIGLAFWEGKLSSTTAATQAQLATIADGFSGSAEYTALYTGQSNAQIVNNLYLNLFGRAAETAGLTSWAAQLAAGTQTFASIALQLTYSAQGTDATAIANKLSAANSFTTALDTTAEITGYSGTTAAASARTWLATVTDVASTLTAATATATLDAAVASAVTAGTSSTGTTFTLTTAIDSFTGTTSNDTFVGDAGSAGLADTLVGGSGTDTLQLFGAAAKPNFSGIETVYLSGNTAGFDVSDKADVTLLELVDPTTAQTYTTTTGQAVKLATMVAGETITFAGNTPTSLAMTLNSVAATGADVTVALTGTALTSLALTTATAASQVTLTNAGAVLATVTVAGDKALELGSALTTITTINASASTGGVDIDAIGASVLAFTGGSGNDRINMAATLGATDVIVGGSGTDTLAISDADTLTTAIATGVSGFEILEVTTADATAYDVDTIISKNTLTGILSSETGGAAHTISNINSGAITNIKFTGNTPTAVALTGKGFVSGGTTDAATIILDNSVDDNADGVDIATTLTFTLVDKLTINATSDDTTAARAIVNSVTGLTATDLDTIYLTGNAANSVTLAATTAALQEVDASASTGANTFVGTAAAIATMVYRGNSKVDTVTMSDAASNGITLFTGGGSDVLVLGVTGAAHTLNFTATALNSGDVLAGNAITINTGAAFQAGDTVTLDFSSTLEGLLKSGSTILSSASANIALVGTTISATSSVAATDGGNNTTLYFDLNGDGTFTAASDFSIEILGLANNTLNYIAATDVFTFTAAA